ncbi:hypothetical protein BDV95DRAFT_210186 [Massariosphaeria phaeospora]|uniref:Uncharacterized protein n=1 Tax=Massariosphaeria phaeospora TaxID=100035 RepID=A0A7C8HZM5_9PLEO|nr:hypothetical protein BDV95DRAFT_210186 [Massariosphaeria phaeospora]
MSDSAEKLRLQVCATLQERDGILLSAKRDEEKEAERVSRERDNITGRIRKLQDYQQTHAIATEIKKLYTQKIDMLLRFEQQEITRKFVRIGGTLKWERDFAAVFLPYSKLVCLENARNLHDRMNRLPLEIREAIYSYIVVRSETMEPDKIYIKNEDIILPGRRSSYICDMGITHHLSHREATGLIECLERRIDHSCYVKECRAGYLNFWNVPESVLHYYEDAQYVGEGMARDISLIYYRHYYFDLGTNLHLLQRFLDSDRLGFGFAPANLIRRLALCIKLRKERTRLQDEIIFEGDSEFWSQHQNKSVIHTPQSLDLSALSTLQPGCTVELTVLIDKGTQGLKQFRAILNKLFLTARKVTAKAIRLNIYIHDNDRGPWYIRDGGPQSIERSLLSIRKKAQALAANGSTLDTRAFDGFSAASVGGVDTRVVGGSDEWAEAATPAARCKHVDTYAIVRRITNRLAIKD